MNSADSVWIESLIHVNHFGRETSPRGMAVKEVVPHTSITDMNYSVLMNTGRKIGYKFMAAEAAWILSGMKDVETISKYSKDISKFSDDGISFFGAYGPKITMQLGHVIEKLVEDRDTRQAVINIWRESPPESKDIPCTLSLQFMIRGSKLICVASMRSSDLWLGHPYDVFNFSALSFYIQLHLRNRGLNVFLGDLILTAGSKHIYERNYRGVKDVIKEYIETGQVPRMVEPVFKLEKFNSPEHFISALWKAADSDNGVFNLVFG